MTKRFTWRMGALASAVALLSSLTHIPAHALGLGRITVQSALGEALRAEIDIADITAEEASSLKVAVASADAFKTAGLEYTPAVVGVQISLQKRADGRSYLRLSSARPVAEPFVDLILEANWASGRIVRDYTMLFDPPSLRQAGGAAAPVAPTAPGVSRAPTPPIPAAASVMPRNGSSSVPAAPAVSMAPVAKAPPAKARATPAAPKTATGGQQVAVKAGDTASKIAAQVKPASISLDQMLVALLRSNPEAFIGGNVNRLKSGAVLEIPGTENIGTMPADEASRTIVAQSKDFNDFRRKLAEGVSTTQAGGANRQAAGKVQAKVEDRATATATPDKLTLSKGAVQSKAAAEEKIAKDRQTKEASARVAELSKNIGDLNKLSSAPAAGVAVPSAGTAGPAASASTAKGVGVSVAKSASPAVVAAAPGSTASAPTPAAAASASKPTTATVAAATPDAASATAATTTTTTTTVIATVTTAALAAPQAASSGAASAAVGAPVTPAVPAVPVLAKKPAAVVQPPLPEPSLIDEMVDSAFVLPALGGLLVLLAGLGFYRYKKRSGLAQVDSSFLESRLQPDSFFGASGGQRIDTSEGGATGSSLVYSPSQLDAAGDVDPVAEADVYLAYGRDLQAEEILKEALRTNPTRVAVHAKLMEIYAKRRDVRGFEAIAVIAFNLTHGAGPEWAYIGEMGRDLDPENPMYQPGGHPEAASRGDGDANASPFGVNTVPVAIEPQHEASSDGVDFDLDLDFSLGDEPPAAPQATATASASHNEPTVTLNPAPEPMFEGLNMDFGADTVALKPTLASPMDGGLSFDIEPPAAPKLAPAPVAAAIDSGMLEFDLGSLSLDLDGPVTESPALARHDQASAGSSGTPATADGPLETKFALAEEFRTLGDMDGARSLAQEVVSHAHGSLKSKAQAFLNALA